jgi:protein involved in polysaccharide export with SLBB domain
MTARRCLRITAGFALALLTAGCLTSDPTQPAVGSPTELRVAPGDKIRIVVFGEDKLSGDYQIDNDGNISMPLAGTIKGAGLTKAELEQQITTGLKSKYLRDPKVTVDVISYRPFYVLGEVSKPGEYPFRSGLNVLSAIAIAGGATYRANNSKVTIQRFGETQSTEAEQSSSVLIMPGDVVRVPERFF